MCGSIEVNLFYFGQFIDKMFLEDFFRDGRVTGNKNIFYLGLIKCKWIILAWKENDLQT